MLGVHEAVHAVVDGVFDLDGVAVEKEARGFHLCGELVGGCGPSWSRGIFLLLWLIGYARGWWWCGCANLAGEFFGGGIVDGFPGTLYMCECPVSAILSGDIRWIAWDPKEALPRRLFVLGRAQGWQ